VLIGLPDLSAFEAAERGEIVLGGCVVDTDSPAYHCANCGRKFTESEWTLARHTPPKVEVPSRGLIIASPGIDKILGGRKDWEMRTTSTRRRGRIGLIRKGSGAVQALASVAEVLGPFERDELLRRTCSRHHRVPLRTIEAGLLDGHYAWVLRDLHVLRKPVSYTQKMGPVIWVVLDDATQRRLTRADRRRIQSPG
jgi:hypothetical protein